MRKVLDFTKVPLDKWVNLFEYVEKTWPNTLALFDIREVSWVDVPEESDIDRELAEKLHDLEGQAVLALPKEIQELLKKKSEFKSKEKK